MFVVAFLCPVLSYGQYGPDSSTHWIFNKYFSLGSPHAGIGVGNSRVYTGIRLNLLNSRVERTNILDISVCGDLKPESRHISNGISLSASIGGLHKNNGVSAALVANALHIENGVAVSGFLLMKKLNGLGISAIGSIIDTVNGVSLSFIGSGFLSNDDRVANRFNGLAIGGFSLSLGEVHGMTVSLANKAALHGGLSIGVYNEVKQYKGMQLGLVNMTEVHKGVQLGLLNIANAHNGVSIGFCNQTNKLKGVQFGLINIAENNPKGFRMLPFFNMHLRS